MALPAGQGRPARTVGICDGAGYGGEIVSSAPKMAARVHDNDARVIAAQATCALALHDAVLTPIGGCGLIRGTALPTVAPETRIYAAEPANADDAVDLDGLPWTRGVH